MKVLNTKKLKIVLNSNDAENFISAINKLADESKTIGFKNSNLSEKEAKLINELSDKFKFFKA